MNTKWILIETLAIFVDGLTKVYFLNSRYISKYESIVPQLLAWLSLVGWGFIATFLGFSGLLSDGTTYLIIFIYLFMTKYGTFAQKAFGVVLTFALVLGTSIAGAGVASMISNVSVEHTLEFQDSSRLLAIILIKTLQIILFYILSKKHFNLRTLQNKPVVVLTSATILVLLCLLFMFNNLSDFNDQTNYILIWLATGLLFILVGIFIMYELFVREETRNIDLSVRLQRLEMETQFFKELDVVQTDLRTWRHEHKNNLIVLRALIEAGLFEKSLEFLDKISVESSHGGAMLQTGNLVLDAVVSSKLMLAHSLGIKINIQAVYPEINSIADNDLCAIVGNLLDNAIEACERMRKKDQARFINFSLLVKGKNLSISIQNSYDGDIKREGKKFLTAKDNRLHGIGIQYVDSIMDKYQGHVLRDYKDGVFKTHVMLPLIPAKERNNDEVY